MPTSIWLQKRPEELGGGVQGVAVDDVVEGGRAQQLCPEGVVDQARQLFVAEVGREVKGGAGGGGGDGHRWDRMWRGRRSPVGRLISGGRS
jgi:hypothetical protein